MRNTVRKYYLASLNRFKSDALSDFFLCLNQIWIWRSGIPDFFARPFEYKRHIDYQVKCSTNNTN
jgi:hypothetical protein